MDIVESFRSGIFDDDGDDAASVSSSAAGSCGFCLHAIEINAQLGAVDYNLPEMVFTVALVASLLYLFIKINRAMRLNVDAYETERQLNINGGVNRGPALPVLKIYFQYIPLACVWFLFQAVGFFLPASELKTWLCLVGFFGCGFFDNVVVAFLFMPDTKMRSRITAGALGLLAMVSYIVFLAFYDFGVGITCSWCAAFVPVVQVRWMYAFYCMIYLFVAAAAGTPILDKMGVPHSVFRPRPAALVWTVFLLWNYGTMAIGLMLVRRGVDAGFCFIFVGVLSYNMLYAPLLYRVAHADTLYIKDRQEEAERDPLLEGQKRYTTARINRVFTDSAVKRIEFSELTVHRIVGQGSFGAVYFGSWQGTDVAVKKLLYRIDLPTAQQQEMVEEFLKEISVLSALRHPNIVLFMGGCTSTSNLCIVTEYLANGSLFDYIGDPTRPRFTWTQTVKVASEIARGMAFLHNNSPPIIHRDLKSGNILLDERLNAKVADFGMSKMQDLNSTMTANKIGTPQWSPPEVLRGDPYSRQADVYAMGIILHELYSGIHPYPTTQANHVAYRVAFGLLTVHFGDGGTSPDSDEGAPPVFVALARACLAPELEERPLFPEVLDRIMDWNIPVDLEPYPLPPGLSAGRR